MSEPSPEAKQAAEDWAAPVEITSFREAFAYGYDAATAKHTIEEYKTAIEQIVVERTAELRSAQDKIRGRTVRMGDDGPDTPDVEKIAREAAIACIEFIRSEGQFRLVRDSEVQTLLRPFLAQARAPLVAVIQVACRNMQLGYNQQARNILEAAPTGTGDK